MLDTAAALWEIEAIKQLKARYCRYLDAKRWDDWRELFTDDFRFAFAASDTSGNSYLERGFTREDEGQCLGDLAAQLQRLAIRHFHGRIGAVEARIVTVAVAGFGAGGEQVGA